MEWDATRVTNVARSLNIPARCNITVIYTAAPTDARHVERPSVADGIWKDISTKASTGAPPTGSALDQPEATIATPASDRDHPWRWPWPPRGPFPAALR